MNISRIQAAFAAALLATAAHIVVACSDQGEGERCSTLNGNEDCSGELVCTDKDTLGTDSDICCPANLESDHPACIPGSLGGPGGGGSSATGGSNSGGAGAEGGGGASGGAGGAAGGSGGSGGAAGGSGGSSSGGAGGSGGT